MLEIFKIIGTIALNNKDAIDSMNETVGLGQSMATKLGGFAATAGKAIVTAASAAAAGIGAMATGIATITKSAVDNYGEYEQLVGGSKLMFGDAYDFIAEKAANAFNTVQMSQNDYLQQVNGFATGLKTALNGDSMAAAELADKILNAEADVVAATGNSQEAVQNAFNGIMKSNYTMLDNLQLGIKPTKEGMQEVIDKVNEWNAANGNATHYMIDNLADTQAALVDYISMQGLAGYASDEAAGTIQGSMASVKAAWDNLMTGFADPEQDIDKLLNNFILSADAFLDNMLPRISQAIPRVIQGLSSMIQQAAGYVPDLLKDILPALMEGAVSLLTELVNNVPSLLSKLLPQAIDAIQQVLENVLPEIITKLPQLLSELLPQAIDAVRQLLENVLPEIITELPQLLNKLLPQAIDAVSSLLTIIVEQIPQIIEDLFSGINEDMGSKISGLFSEMVNLGQELYPQIQELFATLIEVAPQLLDIVFQVIDAVKPIFSLLSPILTLITSMIQPLTSIVLELLTPLVGVLGNAISLLVPVLSDFFGQLSTLFPYIQQIFEYISPALDGLWQSLNVVLEGCVLLIQGVFDVIMGIITFYINLFSGDFEAAWDSFLQMLKGFWELIKGFLYNAFFSLIASFRTNLFDKILELANNIYDSMLKIIFNAVETIKEQIEKIKGFFDFKWKLPDLKMPHFKVEGEFSLNPLKVPTFGVDWYAKAMDNPMLLTQPTAFGINAAGQIMAGGENGAEVVSGADTLMNMIASTVAAQNKELIDVLTHILSAVVSMDDNMGNNMREAIEGTTLSVGNREFARLVRGVV